MADKYKNFSELSASEVKGEDYKIVVKERKSPVIVIAPHGGGIESRTSEIAKAIAKCDWSLYIFAGLKPRGNSDLHLTSTRFDEPTALSLLARHRVAIAIHGKSGAGEFVEIGGANKRCAKAVFGELERLGIDARLPSNESVAGTDKNNVCNRTQLGGVQLEISRELREVLIRDGAKAFSDAIRNSINVVDMS